MTSNNWVSKGGLAGAKRHDSKHDTGLSINSVLGQTKSTCYQNLTGTNKKPLNTKVTQHKIRSKTKKADMYHKHITNGEILNTPLPSDIKTVEAYYLNGEKPRRNKRGE